MIRTLTAAALLAAIAALPAVAEITIENAYVRTATPGARTGAAFMEIHNDGPADRLVGVSADFAARAELHTHDMSDDGVARMGWVEEGFAIPAQGSHRLGRGGDHVMLMGLARPLAQGETVTLTLEFEDAGTVTIDLPVDREREEAPAHGGH